jgi:hypothetical protein
MADLDRLANDDTNKSNAVPTLDGQEDEKERTIAKAALTIAELGMNCILLYCLRPIRLTGGMI